MINLNYLPIFILLVTNRVEVPYKFNSQITEDSETGKAILAAIIEFKAKSCIDWVPVEQTDNPNQYHVEFIKGSGCYSYIGDARSFMKVRGFFLIFYLSLRRSCPATPHPHASTWVSPQFLRSDTRGVTLHSTAHTFDIDYHLKEVLSAQS